MQDPLLLDTKFSLTELTQSKPITNETDSYNMVLPVQFTNEVSIASQYDVD